MAQNLFDVAGTGNRSYTLLDDNFKQLWSLRDLITTAAHGAYSGYTAANVKATFDGVGFSILMASGGTAATSALYGSADQTLYSVLGGGNFGPGIQARWDSATTNRYLMIGQYNNAGAWTNIMKFDNDRNALVVGDGGLGYGTGSGGSVSQSTSKSTGATLNKSNGQITMHSASLAANTAVSFTLTNSTIAATDKPDVAIASGATAGAYVAVVDAVAAGSCRISLRNMTGGALAEAVVLNFVNIKAVTS